jgi:hypothetical protein
MSAGVSLHFNQRTALQNQKRAGIFTNCVMVAAMVRELLMELKDALFDASEP